MQWRGSRERERYGKMSKPWMIGKGTGAKVCGRDSKSTKSKHQHLSKIKNETKMVKQEKGSVTTLRKGMRNDETRMAQNYAKTFRGNK